MGMSTHISGFKPPDERFEQMKRAFEACEEAQVQPPDKVVNFFNGEEPDPAGVEVALQEGVHYQKWGDHYRSGFELNIADLPEDVKVIRFYNSW